MSNFALFLTILIITCVLLGCNKVQANQDSAPPALMVDPPGVFDNTSRFLSITDMINEAVETDPMAYIVHKNISKLPELQVENYPVIFFWVDRQEVYKELGMNFEQIKQHATDEKLLNFVKSYIVVEEMKELRKHIFSAPQEVKSQIYKNILGDEIRFDSRYILNKNFHPPTYMYVMHLNGVPVSLKCFYADPRMLEVKEDELSLICPVEKTLF